MACPDWRELSAGSRDERWQDAIEHSRSCSRCRQESTAVDPLSVFSRMEGPDLELDEAELMVSRVRGARSLRRSDSLIKEQREQREQRASTTRRWGTAVAAATVTFVLGAGLLGLRSNQSTGEVAAGAATSNVEVASTLGPSATVPNATVPNATGPSATVPNATGPSVGGVVASSDGPSGLATLDADAQVVRQLEEHLDSLPVVDMTLVADLAGGFEVAESSSVEFQLAGAQWDLVWVVDSELEL